MEPFHVGIYALIAVLFLLANRVPIAAALGVVASLGIFVIFAWRPGQEFAAQYAYAPTLSLMANSPYAFITSSTLSTVPLFILMGHLAYEAGFTTDIYRAARLWLAKLPGGLAMASVVGCGGFSAITGSSVACAAAMGRIAIPEMLRFGYAPSLATGTVAIGGTLGSLIPPSVLFILFGIFAEQSIARLFIAAIIPGIISLLAYMLVIYLWVKMRPSVAPNPNEDISAQERMRSLMDCWAILTLFVVVIGGIYLGLFTPTEAAGIGASATFILGFALGRLSVSRALAALKESVYQTSMIFVIAIGGKLFVNFIALTGLASEITFWIESTDASMFVVIGLIVIMYIFLGMFLDPIGIILLSLPLTIPIIEAYGLSLIWFGVVVVKLLEIGLVTPPIGLNVFVIKSIVDKTISLESIFKGVGFFLIAEIFVLALIICVPSVSLFLASFV
ncbi:TRAP transporter large permease [Alphaproteobacteria bacterium]|jgi:C4-dicarboxylate transporter DctM subunit|nr:TRAP transporter large permease [Alphaproteobacteria bacterium]